MAFSTFAASVPVFHQTLTSLSALLEKADAHAEAAGISVSELLEARLAPDMFHFTRQIQIACDHAKGCTARLAGIDIPKFEDTEKTVAELQARIAKTQAFIASVTPEQFEGAEERDIKLVFPWASYDFSGARYLTYWALPNFFFHASTAYNILRHQGVAIGKADFLGAQPA
ncbi:MAG: DUF1993 domain-containing protein [Moraxellaceae bacterium]|nr:DUF1993 domain-containing protein [Moraxellaceae bacterium]